MRMRAAVLEEFGKPLNVQEIELADPRPGEVLVRLVACGVCHTDLYTASRADAARGAPAVLGHEGAAAEPGPPARRHGAPVPRPRADPPLHGHEHVRGVPGDAGD